MEEKILINGREFRRGYTTGSCAAAASKAAVKMLADSVLVSEITIDTPSGVRLTLPVSGISFHGNRVKCAVIKDGGSDPDRTTGLPIFAEAYLTDRSGEIEIQAGEGIGIVTLPGLKVAAGQPAINPVPMQMIRKEVDAVLPEDQGVAITLSVPGGAEAAQHTFNPRLGIIGGISILGTTGIVEPMSEEAWKESLALELSVKAAQGLKTVVYVFGNIGEKFVRDQLGLDSATVVKIGNFVGFMLEKAVELHFEQVLIAGHPGKLVKVAGGIFLTHSKIADARMEILAALAALEGAPREVAAQIYQCRTTMAAQKFVQSNRLDGIWQRVVDKVSERCREYIFGRLQIGALLFDEEENLLAMDDHARKILVVRGKVR